MSMLAERKRKQRWLLNPRGKQFVEDKNGFGHKMMQKMGWNHGKGLGANENGMTESLRVTYKNDTQGMGYKEVEQWTAHDDNFSALLKNLNGDVVETNIDKKVTSLEKKSQNTRARIHYHKFTKSKDISRYSEKDIANILGKKTLKQNDKKKCEVVEEIKDDKKDVDGNLISKGSMVDYFKKKLPNFYKNKSSYTIANNGVLAIEKSDSEDERVGFGFGFLPQKRKRGEEEEVKEENIEEIVNCAERQETKKKKKDKKKKENCIFHVYETKEVNNDVSQQNSENMEQKKETIEEKKKYKTKECLKDDEMSEKSVESNLSQQKEDKIEEKKKKKKYKTNEYFNEDDCIEESVGPNLSQQKEETIEAKKKKKIYNTNKCLKEESSEESLSIDPTQPKLEVIDTKKKKRTCKTCLKEDETNAENLEENSENLQKLSNKKSKEEKNCKFNKESQIEIVNFIENTENFHKPKRKKTKEIEVDDVIEEIMENIETEGGEKLEMANLHKTKHKQLKNKKEEIIENIEIKHKEEKCTETILKIEENDNLNHSSSKSKKKKSKKKNPENSLIEEHEAKNEIGDKESRGKRKIKQEDSIDTKIMENCNGKHNESEENIKKHKKHKKSKKNKEENEIGISNLAFSDFNSTITDDTTIEVDRRDNSTPNKKKQKYEIVNEGIENPTFNISVDSINEAPTNPYEIKQKKKKKSENIERGLDNPALNLSDVVISDNLMLNVVTTPILKKEVPKYLNIQKIKNVRRKSVRFSDVLQERIIPNDPSERTNEYITNRNELFDINTLVIEENLKEEMEKQGLEYKNELSNPDIDNEDISKQIVESSVKEELNRNGSLTGFINNGFDIRSVDKINFYECKHEVKSPNNKKGIDNKAFNKVKNEIEENIESISNKIEEYQAEIENDINESKDNKNYRFSNRNFNVNG